MARRGAPKRRFPAHESDPRLAYALVHDELLLDGVARMNLATFCTTWAEPEVLALLAESFDKNIVDKDEYPQTAELEARCVRMLADLWHSPHPGTTLGTSTTGSSEAAMLAGLAAKFRWRERRGGRRQADRAAQLRVRPGAGVLGEVRALLRRRDPPGADGPGRYLMEPEQCLERCDENTIMVVATLGQTFTGLFEDVAGIAAALDRLAGRAGPRHPAARGRRQRRAARAVHRARAGVGLPHPAREVDQRLRAQDRPRAARLRLGDLARKARTCPSEMIFNVNYLGGEMPTFNLNFSRPGGQVVTQYYDFIRLGREGLQPHPRRHV